MFAKAGFLCAAILAPSLLYADALGLRRGNTLDATNHTGHIVWAPTAHGKARFSYLLPEAGIREAIEFQDTTSLYYLSRVAEQPIIGQVTAAPVARVDMSKDTTQVSANWFISPTVSLGLGAIRHDSTTEPVLHGAMILAPSATELTTLSLDVLGDTQLQFDRASLHINERSETLLYAAVSDDDGQSLSLSYGRRVWDAFAGIDFAWAAGIERDKGFGRVQIERDLKRMRSAFHVTLTEHASLELGLSLEIALGAHPRYGDWTGRIASGTRRDTALDRPSLRTYRRDYMATLWRQEVTIEMLKQGQN
jgi:hypothetical protein